MSKRVQLLLEKYFQGVALQIVAEHSRAVADLALEVCQRIEYPKSEWSFVEESALLHDIGVCRIEAPSLGLCSGYPYIMHGILGREILEQEGLPLHALVCERHIGVGISAGDIVRQGLPLPHRDMVPVSVAEQIVCFADLFYSKTPGKILTRKSADKVRSKLSVFGEEKVQIFDNWLLRFWT